MMGIDVDRVIASTFFIGSALAGAAGVMFGLVFGQIYHYMGFIAGLKGFTAAVIGGIGSIPGAMVGGLLVGLAESYATGYLPQGSTFQNLYVFALLILIILIRAERPVSARPTCRRSDDAGPATPDSPGSAADRRRRMGRVVEGKRERYSGLSGACAAEWDRYLAGRRLLVFAVPAAIFPFVTTEGNLFRYGLFTLVYALLALGLNIVVGFAGLLDLGYVAFFGFGAYMYGILASPSIRPPLAGRAGDSGRDRRTAHCWASSSACRRAVSSATTSRSSRSSSARRSSSSSTTRTGSTSRSSATSI